MSASAKTKSEENLKQLITINVNFKESVKNRDESLSMDPLLINQCDRQKRVSPNRRLIDCHFCSNKSKFFGNQATGFF